MKEKIYTIPVNEAYEQDTECPLCFLEKKLENDACEYALGAAMMEPDYRILSNEKGYCNKHFSKLFELPNKLSLALVLDTHICETRKKLDVMKNTIDNLNSNKKTLFKKVETKQSIEVIADKLGEMQNQCVVCDTVSKTMDRYIDVLLYLWENESEFAQKFKNSHGMCLKHLSQCLHIAAKTLKNDSIEKFTKELMELEKKDFELLNEDIHKFTLKFDYRNKDMEWGTAADSPIRSIEKLVGKIDKKDEI